MNDKLKALALAKSMILSGERMSEQAERIIDAALRDDGGEELADYRQYYETMETPGINPVKYLAIRRLRERIEARRQPPLPPKDEGVGWALAK
jgi:hypothetical protein